MNFRAICTKIQCPPFYIILHWNLNFHEILVISLCNILCTKNGKFQWNSNYESKHTISFKRKNIKLNLNQKSAHKTNDNRILSTIKVFSVKIIRFSFQTDVVNALIKATYILLISSLLLPILTEIHRTKRCNENQLFLAVEE